MSELKPCPFCGGRAESIYVPRMFDGAWCVECHECGARCGYYASLDGSDNNAVLHWNTRTSDARVKELEAEVERLNDAARRAIDRIGREGGIQDVAWMRRIMEEEMGL